MCTLILAHRVVPGTPLVVLANRDEMLGRPSRAPSLLCRDPAIFCGQDAKDGGTWCGVNEHGLFVGLTNLTLYPPDPERRSRGLLCLEMLRRKTAREVRDALAGVGSDDYNAFNLVAGGARAEDLGVQVLQPGESMSAQMTIEVSAAP